MTYTNNQTMLSLAYISYYGFGLIGSDEENAKHIEGDINKALKTWPAVKDQWELVWGPGVFAFKDVIFDDNLMYVVRNIKDPTQYVVAIRGTNPVSLSDWLVEDFDVIPMVKWKYGKPDYKLKPKISKSTSIGITHLQEMVAPAGVPGAGTTILEFFQQNIGANDKASICFTGHSLGGALSPTMALWMKDIQDEELKGDVTVSTVAFAGPSAGNKDFATYSDSRFEEGQCTRIWNNLDVVPYAWNTHSLSKLYSLYLPHLLLPGPIMTGFISTLIAASLFTNYTQIQKKAPPLKGKFKPLLFNYFAQGVYQHVVGYPEAMGLCKNNEIPVYELFPDELAVPETPAMA